MGPKGTNPVSGAPYRCKTAGSHGGFCEQGVFFQARTQNGRFGPTIGLHDVLDGTSNTLMVGEISWANDKTGTRYRSWVRGTNWDDWSNGCRNVANSINTPAIGTFNDIAFGSMHPGGANFCFTDGSVKFISQNVALGVYKSTASRNGGEANVIANN
jgi:prepilin-type processing-associated H-X9-DG protein